MFKKRAWRYECEFCGKRTFSASHMSKHEKRCTMNPNRYCGFCDKLLADARPVDAKPNDIPAIVASLPDASNYHTEDEWGDSYNQEYLNHTLLPLIEEKTDGCPACTLAVIRQAGIPAPAVTDFKFNAKRDTIWAAINHKQRLADEEAMLTESYLD